MMPVHVNYSGTKVPENGTYYMVARNGMLMHVRNDWVDAVVPMKEFQALEPVEIRAQLKLPPIDALVFAKAVAFFSSIYIRYGTEAIVLLHYGAELGWQLSVPRQQVSRSQVRYKMDERIAGYQCVGTMHSHADMLAGHSHVDIADEGVFDGVHLTVGSLERVPQFSLDAEIVVRGQRFPLGIEHIGGVQIVEPVQPSRPRFLRNAAPAARERDDASPAWSRRYRRRPTYSFDPAILAGWEVPQEWIGNVAPPPPPSLLGPSADQLPAPGVGGPASGLSPQEGRPDTLFYRAVRAGDQAIRTFLGTDDTRKRY